MSPRVSKGLCWFKQTALYCGICLGVSLFFAFNSGNTVNKVADAIAVFVAGIVVFGSLAFVAGWIWGGRDARSAEERKAGS